MTKKRKIIYITIAAAIVIIAALAIIFMPKAAPQTVTEMLSTAQKYLVEMDYERAIAEFNKVIELDPMNADAYLGLAEAYEKSGDIDKAVEMLEKGFELTGDERLQARLALLNGENTAGLTESEEVKYVNVQEYEIPTNITSLELIGPDTKRWSYSFETDESRYVYKLNEPLTDISFLSNFTELESLNLSLNNISDISALSGLTNLTCLYLTENQISDISALSELTNLKVLYLDVNQISDVSALSELKNLNALWIYENQISDISSLSKLINLTDLDLSNNPISESDIEALKSALPNCEINY